jgi:nicotinamide-nucleotide amidase
MIDTIKNLVLETAKNLQSCGLTLATAESCTGGGLSYWLTSVPGSSAWFERGFVTYSNAAKIDLLGVSEKTISTFGAVSEETALEMADGILRHSKADLGIAITGIAGPDGGSPEKPVGTVWLAFSGKNFNTIAECHVFKGDRQAVRLAAIAKALEELLRLI